MAEIRIENPHQQKRISLNIEDEKGRKTSLLCYTDGINVSIPYTALKCYMDGAGLKIKEIKDAP